VSLRRSCSLTLFITANEVSTAANPDRTEDALRSAAKDAFKGMSWDQLEAHRRNR
jgi:hypothetical protein